jgi:hypothetical protein
MAGIAPVPTFPERGDYTYERTESPASPGLRGPLRFEEGIATDTSVPGDFMEGMADGYNSAPGRPNHNMNVYEKPAAQTVQERAHLGSAAWTESPTFLGEFSNGAGEGNQIEYVDLVRSGTIQRRINPALVND